ncbi:hypothetical protein INR49_027282 [Caranx melampygus]|nr:hypothetical protein INR49_027282 [Caranx melampygus]
MDNNSQGSGESKPASGVSLEAEDLSTPTQSSPVSPDTDEFILPTGAALGAVNGLRMGLKETRDMAWSKPRNVQILNMVTRQGASWANSLGSVALLYSVFGVAIEKARGAEDDLNTVAAGTLTGMLFKSGSGVRGIARGGLVGLALSGAYALYNNWDHLTGSPPPSSRLY